MVLKQKKEQKLELPMQISAGSVVKAAAAAFLVRIVFYFIVSLFFVWLLSWAGIVAFSFKYVVVMSIGIFLFYILFGKFSARY